MLGNKPCIFSSKYTNNWNARKEWVDESGNLNIGYLKGKYGDFTCPVIIDELTSKCIEMKFVEFIDNYINRNEVGYLKDWHFQSLCYKNSFPQVYKLFSILNFDWINNELWTETEKNPFENDYRFLYFGPKDSWTKFHCDVMASYSWSANIVGKKKWYFVPIGNEKYFLENNTSDLYIHDLRERKNLWDKAGVFEITQNAGEVIFVPSGMWHQVHNEMMTISLNHNFINCSNINSVYNLLQRRNKDVEHEIEDVISMNIYTEEEIKNIKENILKLDIKINYKMFNQLIILINESRRKNVEDFEKDNNLIINITEDNFVDISKQYCNCCCYENVCKYCFYIMNKLDLFMIKNICQL